MMYVADYDNYMPVRLLGNIDLHKRLQPYVKSAQLFNCPSQTDYIDGAGNIDPLPNPYTSYAMNSDIASFNTTPNMAVIQDTARTVLIGEHRGGVDRSSPFNNSFIGIRGYPAIRHLDGVNLLFCDGHVKWFPKDNPGLTCVVDRDLNGTWWKPTASTP